MSYRKRWTHRSKRKCRRIFGNIVDDLLDFRRQWLPSATTLPVAAGMRVGSFRTPSFRGAKVEKRNPQNVSQALTGNPVNPALHFNVGSLITKGCSKSPVSCDQ
jgi:hypothetical protein